MSEENVLHEPIMQTHYKLDKEHENPKLNTNLQASIFR